MKEMLVCEKEEIQKPKKISMNSILAEKERLFQESLNQKQVEKPSLTIKKTQSIVEKPNFDKLQKLTNEKQKKFIKIKKHTEAEKPKHKTNKTLKIVLIALCFCLIGGLFTYTTVEVVKASSSISTLQKSYDANLLDLIQKINSVETGNRSLDLFETYPEQNLGASSLNPSSNWFDRFCNFMAGIFGG